MKISNKIKSNPMISGALMLTVTTLLVKIFGLIYKVPLSYILSDEGMGYFNSAYSVYSFFYVISTAGVPKAISILTARDEKEQGTVKSALSAFLILGLILSFSFFAFSKSFAILIGSEKSYLAMLAISPSVLFVAASGVLRGYFNGKLKLLPISVSELISAAFKLVLGLIFAYIGTKYGFAVYETSALSILGISIGSFFSFIYLYLSLPKEEKRRKKVINIKEEYSHFKKIIILSAPLTLSAGVGSLINLIDVGLILRKLENAGFSELQANIIYGNYTTLVIPMFNLVATLIAPFAAVLLPVLVKSHKNNDLKSFYDKTELFLKIAIYITAPISILFIVYPERILSFIFEDGSAKMAAPLLIAIAPALIFMGLVMILNTVAEAKGKFKIPIISLTAGSLLKLLFAYLFTQDDRINILSAPLGTLASYVLSFLISYSLIKFKGKKHLSVFVPIIISCTFSLISVNFSQLFLKEYREINARIYLILGLSLFAIFYVFLAFFYNFSAYLFKKIYICDKKASRKLSI